MEFTKEAWENAPEGARLEYSLPGGLVWQKTHLVGYMKDGHPVIEHGTFITMVAPSTLRITLPKRKVTVQLWQLENGALCSTVDSIESAHEYAYTLLGEHTFEIEGRS